MGGKHYCASGDVAAISGVIRRKMQSDFYAASVGVLARGKAVLQAEAFSTSGRAASYRRGNGVGSRRGHLRVCRGLPTVQSAAAPRSLSKGIYFLVMAIIYRSITGNKKGAVIRFVAFVVAVRPSVFPLPPFAVAPRRRWCLVTPRQKFAALVVAVILTALMPQVWLPKTPALVKRLWTRLVTRLAGLIPLRVWRIGHPPKCNKPTKNAVRLVVRE